MEPAQAEVKGEDLYHLPTTHRKFEFKNPGESVTSAIKSMGIFNEEEEEGGEQVVTIVKKQAAVKQQLFEDDSEGEEGDSLVKVATIELKPRVNLFGADSEEEEEEEACIPPPIKQQSLTPEDENIKRLPEDTSDPGLTEIESRIVKIKEAESPLNAQIEAITTDQAEKVVASSLDEEEYQENINESNTVIQDTSELVKEGTESEEQASSSSEAKG